MRPPPPSSCTPSIRSLLYNLSGYCPLPSQFSFLAFSQLSFYFTTFIFSPFTLPSLSFFSPPLLPPFLFSLYLGSTLSPFGQPELQEGSPSLLYSFTSFFFRSLSYGPKKRFEEFIDSCGWMESFHRVAEAPARERIEGKGGTRCRRMQGRRESNRGRRRLSRPRRNLNLPKKCQ